MNNELRTPGTVPTTARLLMAGDVVVGSGFTVTHGAWRGVSTPPGKVQVQGYYPGSPERGYVFNGSTRMVVKRA